MRHAPLMPSVNRPRNFLPKPLPSSGTPRAGYRFFLLASTNSLKGINQRRRTVVSAAWARNARIASPDPFARDEGAQIAPLNSLNSPHKGRLPPISVMVYTDAR